MLSHACRYSGLEFLSRELHFIAILLGFWGLLYHLSVPYHGTPLFGQWQLRHLELGFLALIFAPQVVWALARLGLFVEYALICRHVRRTLPGVHLEVRFHQIMLRQSDGHLFFHPKAPYRLWHQGGLCALKRLTRVN